MQNSVPYFVPSKLSCKGDNYFRIPQVITEKNIIKTRLQKNCYHRARNSLNKNFSKLIVSPPELDDVRCKREEGRCLLL